jgi:hypothetical protein
VPNCEPWLNGQLNRRFDRNLVPLLTARTEMIACRNQIEQASV